jgi:hypothetical protein
MDSKENVKIFELMEERLSPANRLYAKLFDLAQKAPDKPPGKPYEIIRQPAQVAADRIAERLRIKSLETGKALTGSDVRALENLLSRSTKKPNRKVTTFDECSYRHLVKALSNLPDDGRY